MWRLKWFGLLIGVLAALSDAAGTTVTLIGLMFALIGGSLLTWYRTDGTEDADAKKDADGKGKNRFTSSQLRAIAETANGIALCILFGLLTGFLMKGIDLFLITPNIPAAPTKRADHKTRKQDNARSGPSVLVIHNAAGPEDLAALGGRLAEDARKLEKEEDQKAVTELSEAVGELKTALESINKTLPQIENRRGLLSDRTKLLLNKAFPSSSKSQKEKS